jgi:PAS domain-containing protein
MDLLQSLISIEQYNIDFLFVDRSPEFRQVANLLMANPHPAALFWGRELTVIYNKAYANTVAGRKHPRLMGAGFTTAGHGFAELWAGVSEIFDQCQRTGESVAVTDQMLPIERHGFLEETFFTWSLTPLYGGTDQILGMYNAPFETTKQTRNARATETLLMLGQETALAQNIAEFWPNILKALKHNQFDFPFALIYSVLEDSDVDEEGSISSESSQSMKSCVLEGTIGVPEGHPAAPTRLDLKRAKGGFIPSFRDAMQTREPKLLKIMDGSLSESLIEGIEWRGYGVPCKEAIVCPVRPTNGENVMGFLVIGVNPRRQFDDDYQAFIRLLDRQLATSLASVTLFEAEIKRGISAAEAAAIERSRLSEELAVQRSRLQRMAEISPVGMCSISPDGVLIEANDRWYEMTGHPRDLSDPMSFMSLIDDKSVEAMQKGWERLIADQMPWSAELVSSHLPSTSCAYVIGISYFIPLSVNQFTHFIDNRNLRKPGMTLLPAKR